MLMYRVRLCRVLKLLKLMLMFFRLRMVLWCVFSWLLVVVFRLMVLWLLLVVLRLGWKVGLSIRCGVVFIVFFFCVVG